MNEYSKDDPQTIEKLFDSIASRYDLGNSLNSFCLHKLWNRRLIKTALKNDPKTLLDLCAGTGEIAKGCLQCSQDLHIVLVDFSGEMLAVAKKRIKNRADFLQANAEHLPLQNESFDAATCAYGIRNIQNRKAAFSELYRVLKPNGTLAICELTRPDNSLLKGLHNAYLATMVPLIGRLLTKNHNAYTYLSKSINSFISKETVAKELQDAGFCNVQIAPQSFGIATLFFANKP